MAREGRVNTSVPQNEYNEALHFCQLKDKRLPEAPQPVDVWRSLLKLAKRSQPVEDVVHEPAVDSPQKVVNPVSHESREILELQSRVLAQKITLEDKKRRTEYWRSVRLGRASAPPKQPQQSVSPSSVVPFSCRLHRVVHTTGPCPEVIQIHKEAGLSLVPSG